MGAANFYRKYSTVNENIVGSWVPNYRYSELVTGSGNDRVNFGWIFNGYASTGAGNDYITSFTSLGRYTINDGDGNDVVNIGGIYLHIQASRGNDYYNIWSGGNVYIDLGVGQKKITTGYVWGELVINDRTRGRGWSWGFDKRINGSSTYTRVYTASGNDKINVWGGINCEVHSEGGNNNIVAKSAFNSYVATGGGNDSIYAVSGGNVTVKSSGGNNNIVAKSVFNSYVETGGGNDSIYAISGGSVTVKSGGGNDNITAGGIYTYVDAGDGDDHIKINALGAQVFAGNGNDTLDLGVFGVSADMGNGNDTVNSFALGGQNIMLGYGNNKAFVVGGLNIVQGAHGDNYVQGIGHGNIFLLGHGQNTVFAYGMGNFIFTGNGENNIQALGGAGNFVMVGDGQNTVRVAGGSNIVWSGNGGGEGAMRAVEAVPQIIIPRLAGSYEYTGDSTIYRRGSYRGDEQATRIKSYYNEEGLQVKDEMWSDRELNVQENMDKKGYFASTGKFYTDTGKSANQDTVLPWWRRGALNRGTSFTGVKKGIRDRLLENTTLVSDEEIRSKRLSKGLPDYDEDTYHYRNEEAIKQDVLEVLNEKYLYADRPGNTIYAHGSLNFVVSGRGDDKIKVGGYTSILGELGDDDIWDEDLPQDHLKNFVTGGGGSFGNMVFAGEGDNVVKAYGMGSNFIMTGSGHDYIVAFGALNIVIAGDGFNKIEVIGAENIIIGGRGQDMLAVMGYRNTFIAGDGDNIMTGSGRENIFIGAGGDDDVMILGVENTVLAGGGDNFILAMGRENTLQGASGNDNIFTSGEKNHIFAGHGHNFILAVGLRNKVWAGDGHDTIMLLGSDNLVLAGDGRNSISLGGLNNKLLSGSGRDTIFMAGHSNMVSSASGADSLRIFGKYNFIHAGGGDDSILTIGKYNATMAGWGDDTIISIGKANITLAGSGRDILLSIGKSNIIFTGSGDDISLAVGKNNLIIGGTGADILVTIGKNNIVLGDNSFSFSSEDLFAVVAGAGAAGLQMAGKGIKKLSNNIKKGSGKGGKLLGSNKLKDGLTKVNDKLRSGVKTIGGAINKYQTAKKKAFSLSSWKKAKDKPSMPSFGTGNKKVASANGGPYKSGYKSGSDIKKPVSDSGVPLNVVHTDTFVHVIEPPKKNSIRVGEPTGGGSKTSLSSGGSKTSLSSGGSSASLSSGGSSASLSSGGSSASLHTPALEGVKPKPPVSAPPPIKPRSQSNTSPVSGTPKKVEEIGIKSSEPRVEIVSLAQSGRGLPSSSSPVKPKPPEGGRPSNLNPRRRLHRPTPAPPPVEGRPPNNPRGRLYRPTPAPPPAEGRPPNNPRRDLYAQTPMSQVRYGLIPETFEERGRFRSYGHQDPKIPPIYSLPSNPSPPSNSSVRSSAPPILRTAIPDNPSPDSSVRSSALPALTSLRDFRNTIDEPSSDSSVRSSAPPILRTAIPDNPSPDSSVRSSALPALTSLRDFRNTIDEPSSDSSVRSSAPPILRTAIPDNPSPDSSVRSSAPPILRTTIPDADIDSPSPHSYNTLRHFRNTIDEPSSDVSDGSPIIAFGIAQDIPDYGLPAIRPTYIPEFELTPIHQLPPISPVITPLRPQSPLATHSTNALSGTPLLPIKRGAPSSNPSTAGGGSSSGYSPLARQAMLGYRGGRSTNIGDGIRIQYKTPTPDKPAGVYFILKERPSENFEGVRVRFTTSVPKDRVVNVIFETPVPENAGRIYIDLPPLPSSPVVPKKSSKYRENLPESKNIEGGNIIIKRVDTAVIAAPKNKGISVKNVITVEDNLVQQSASPNLSWKRKSPATGTSNTEAKSIKRSMVKEQGEVIAAAAGTSYTTEANKVTKVSMRKEQVEVIAAATGTSNTEAKSIKRSMVKEEPVEDVIVAATGDVSSVPAEYTVTSAIGGVLNMDNTDETDYYSESIVIIENKGWEDINGEYPEYIYDLSKSINDKENIKQTSTYENEDINGTTIYIELEELNAPKSASQNTNGANNNLWEDIDTDNIRSGADVINYLSDKKDGVLNADETSSSPSADGSEAGQDTVSGYLHIELVPTIKFPDIEFSQEGAPDWKTPSVTIPQINIDVPDIPELASTPNYMYGNLSTYRFPKIDIPTFSSPEVQFPGVTFPSFSIPNIQDFDINIEDIASSASSSFSSFSNLGSLFGSLFSSYIGKGDGVSQLLGSYNSVDFSQHASNANRFSSPIVPGAITDAATHDSPSQDEIFQDLHDDIDVANLGEAEMGDTYYKDTDSGDYSEAVGELSPPEKKPFLVTLPTLHLPKLKIPEINLIGAFQLSGLDVDHLDETNTNYGDNAYKKAAAAAAIEPSNTPNSGLTKEAIEQESNYISEWGLSRLSNAFMERNFFGIQIPKLFDMPNFSIPDISLHSILGEFLDVENLFQKEFSLALPSFEIPSIPGIDWSEHLSKNLFGSEDGYNILGGGAAVGTPENDADITFTLGSRNRVMSSEGDDINIVVGKTNSVFSGAGDDINFIIGRDTIAYALDGNDILVGVGKSNLLYGGKGDDIVFSLGLNSFVTGGSGKNILATVGLSNTISPMGGTDIYFQVGSKNSIVNGFSEKYVALQVGMLNNAFVSGRGSHLVQIGGSNTAYLNGYDSTIMQVGALNTVISGSGLAEAPESDDIITVMGALNFTAAQEGNDVVLAMGALNNVMGGGGDDIIVSSGIGNMMAGNDGDDVIINLGMNSVIASGAGDDIIINCGGDTTANGGEGDDLLINLKDVVIWSGANEGNDTFVEVGWTMFEAFKIPELGILNNVVGDMAKVIDNISGVFSGGLFSESSNDTHGVSGYYADSLMESIDYHKNNDQYIFGGNGDDKMIAGFSNMFAEGGGGEDSYIYTLGSGYLDIKEERNGEVDTLWLRNNFSQDWSLGYENFYLYQYGTGEHVLDIVHNEMTLGSIALENWADNDIIVINGQDTDGGRMEFIDFKLGLAAISHLDVVDENGAVEDFGYDTEIQNGVAALEVSVADAINWLNYNSAGESHFKFTDNYFLSGGKEGKELAQSKTREAVDDFARAKNIFESVLAPPV